MNVFKPIAHAVAGALIAATTFGQAHAYDCASSSTGNFIATATLASQVAGKYTCTGTFPAAQWNELLSGSTSGTVIDYKMGPSSSTDPTAVVGTYVISDDGAGSGLITYNYSQGGTYAYRVISTPVSGNTYAFCQFGGGSSYLVNIQASHC
jgi:hypothetical protein